jgi:glycosyltransferase involved in cell wall biosynthesis
MIASTPGRAKPRLLVLASTYPRWIGDPEPGFVHELTRRLTCEFDVMVLSPHAQSAAAAETIDGVRIRRYRYAPKSLETLVQDGGIVANLKRSPWKWMLLPGFLISLLWNTWRLLRLWNPGVVHAHWLIPQGLVIAALQLSYRGMPPFLATSHGADLFALRAWPFRMMKRFVLSRATAVTVVSSAMLDELARIGADASCADVQPMGVDLAGRFTPSAGPTRSPQELLFVGRLVEKKGLRHLLDAMPLILAAHPEARLTIAGSGPEAPALRRQADDLQLAERVTFLGAIPQVQLPSLYRRASVFVAPFTRAASGDQEGLGLVAIEAAGCGCRLVLGDVPAVRSVFATVVGTELIAAEDTPALAAACIRALACPDPPSGLVDFVRERFDWETRSQAYARILHGICRFERPGSDLAGAS